MEADLEVLRVELQGTFQRAIELQVTLDIAEGRVPKTGVPHYTVIEEASHRVGCAVSRGVQERHMNEVIARQPARAKCPGCDTRCDLEPKKRKITSGDGEVELQELAGHCPECRRDFFPST
jgi:hypothetical protein